MAIIPICPVAYKPGSSYGELCGGKKGATQATQSSNKLLELLSSSVRSRVMADCERIDLGLKHVLYEANILMTHDRVNRGDFSLTQEFLAQMLGVRRASVTEVAGQLQKEKLIRYNRGFINILNRRGLEKRSCACYWIISGEYDRLLNHRGK